VKKLAKKVLLHTLFRPASVRNCSQTLYEALLGCCRLHEATGDPQWKKRASEVLALLIEIQRPDGGFDIGYDFNFGRWHKKGQSTSPELVALLAFCEYARLFDRAKVEQPARRAAAWIKAYAHNLGDGRWAIPYSPHTIDEIMVYNGTSFACGALGRYLGEFGDDADLRPIYEGMVRYLNGVMSRDENLPGRFWYYSDQSRDDWDERRRDKIDYYHQMQQVEIHSLAQQLCPADEQLALIRDAADHVVALQERDPIVPYTNDPANFKGQIHLWGLSSVVPGLLEAAILLPERADAYRSTAQEVMEWIVTHGWRHSHFADVLKPDGSDAASLWYMVRSDAWVFNAVAAAEKHLGSGSWSPCIEPCYLRMASVNFSGPESHSTCLRRRLATRGLVLAKKLLGKGR